MTAKTNNECELVLDHHPVWAGDGYFCSKCILEFVPKSFLSSERQRILEAIGNPPECLDILIDGKNIEQSQHYIEGAEDMRKQIRQKLLE